MFHLIKNYRRYIFDRLILDDISSESRTENTCCSYRIFELNYISFHRYYRFFNSSIHIYRILNIQIKRIRKWRNIPEYRPIQKIPVETLLSGNV